ncbi:hypothetical protein AWB80_08151 [Caballeronia pedi]|uniref:Uncharacterized protein n=1 Tax=Caballeronia pedi TaxID=1777141 RepID=A0A158E3S4_9BURK|nr:hypothetical protein [Caballeronia pedi]SAL01551.1 hypothetical protein AWB80_08151 [Caballeronia pedi]
MSTANHPFKPGDTATLHKLPASLAHMCGMACRVIHTDVAGIAMDVESGRLAFAEGARVAIDDKPYIVPIEYLKPKFIAQPRDIDAKVSWASCGWMPQEYRA